MMYPISLLVPSVQFKVILNGPSDTAVRPLAAPVGTGCAGENNWLCGTFSYVCDGLCQARKAPAPPPPSNNSARILYFCPATRSIGVPRNPGGAAIPWNRGSLMIWTSVPSAFVSQRKKPSSVREQKVYGSL